MLKTESAQAWAARDLARDAALVLAFAGLTVAGARVSVPLPGTPVPATLQVAAVIFAGAAGGSLRGALSQLLYLALGLAGLPVFAPNAATGFEALAAPTAGYLLAFPLAAWLAGRYPGKRVRWLAAAVGLAAIYLIGAGWLWTSATLAGRGNLAWAAQAGILPFLVFDVLKTGLAVWSAGPVRKRLFNV